MVRKRFICCGIAAAFILSGVAQAQEDGCGLRPSLDVPDRAEAMPAEAKLKPRRRSPPGRRRSRSARWSSRRRRARKRSARG